MNRKSVFVLALLVTLAVSIFTSSCTPAIVGNSPNGENQVHESRETNDASNPTTVSTLDNYIDAKRNEAFFSWMDLIKSSEQIVIGQVGEVVEKNLPEGDWGYFVTEITIKESIKSTFKPGDSICLFQTAYVRQDPLVQKGEEVLLFLTPYINPRLKNGNTFRCMGLFDGQYKIREGKVFDSFVANGSKKTVDNKIWGVDNRLDSIRAMLVKAVAK